MAQNDDHRQNGNRPNAAALYGVQNNLMHTSRKSKNEAFSSPQTADSLLLHLNCDRCCQLLLTTQLLQERAMGLSRIRDSAY
jgi:hypothetical protein